jgi:hypothetical protein
VTVDQSPVAALANPSEITGLPRDNFEVHEISFRQVVLPELLRGYAITSRTKLQPSVWIRGMIARRFGKYTNGLRNCDPIVD